MGNVVSQGMIIVWCGGSQRHSSWWPLQVQNLVNFVTLAIWTTKRKEKF